ncbi:MAG: hypothetical protein JSW66_13155 [Phycisphaerales bacterium]|nr:MAG: hypothetical protein JSW66_13155 [Phycisphaerales bacterium]
MSDKPLTQVFRKKDNLVSLVIAFVAFLVAILGLFTSSISTSSLLAAVLVVLGLLAVTNVIEREARLDQTERKIDDIVSQLSSARCTIFLGAKDIPPLDDYLANADELFYAGGHLWNLVHGNANFLRRWLRGGRVLKLILQDPENPGLRSVRMPCVNYDHTTYVRQIRDTLQMLAEFKKEIPGAKLEVRLTARAPTQSVSIVDGHRGGTDMCMLLHLPESDHGTGPFIRLPRIESGGWFDLFYERYYERLWDEASPMPDSQG